MRQEITSIWGERKVELRQTKRAVTPFGGLGTDTGTVPEQFREVVRWVAQQLHPEHERLLASWPKTLRVEIRGLGEVLFCHATPRSDTEVFVAEAGVCYLLVQALRNTPAHSMPSRAVCQSEIRTLRMFIQEANPDLALSS